MTGIGPYLNFVSGIVQQTILIAVLIGATFALLVGLLLVFNSGSVFRINERLNRWVSSRNAMRPLEEFHSVSKPLYRIHRVVGVLISAGALYSLVVLGSTYGGTAMLNSLSGLGPVRFNSWIAESLRVILLVGNLGALLFGLIFIFRPSALKKLEAWADRRISGRKATKSLEVMHRPADAFVRAHPRVVGCLVIAGSVYVLANLKYVVMG